MIGCAIKHLHPDATPVRDYIVEDRMDGQGPKLTYWNEATLGPRPTAEQLAAAEAEALAAEQSDREAFAAAVALLKQQYATMTPVQKALCVVLRRLVREMRD